ncbi:MAG: STAS domain-containing protein [Ilumatobacteraceae bacterium]
MDVRISLRDVGDVRVVALDGMLDLSSVPVLQSQLRREIAARPGSTLIVDVDGALTIDDVALGVFLGAAATARDAGGDLEVLATSDRWRERFRVTRFELAVTVRDRIV